MPDFPLTQSPRAQSFQVPQGPADEEDLFTQSFSQLAYQAFQKSNPELLDSVVTFKILDVNVDTGQGLGTFILNQRESGEIFFVPAIIGDNAVKPLDVFYSRRLDRYYPLTTEWLQEAVKGSVNEMGTGVTPPRTLSGDVDIRHLVVPPMQGKYTYAADGFKTASMVNWREERANIRRKFAADVDFRRGAEPLRLIDFLDKAPNAVKLGFARFLTKHAGIIKTSAAFYGVKALQGALSLRQEKVAEASREIPMKHDVFMATVATPIQDLKTELGSEAGAAHTAVRLHGFYAKRKTPAKRDAFSLAETPLQLTEPKTTGLYRAYMVDGTTERVLVVTHPVRCAERKDDKQVAAKIEGRYGAHHHRHDCVLVLFEDGRYGEVSGLMVEPLVTTHDDIVQFFGKRLKAEPSNKDYGVFVCLSGLGVKVTEPIKVDGLTSGAQQYSFHANYDWSVVVNKRVSGATTFKNAHDRVLVLSQDYQWLDIKGDEYGPRASSGRVNSEDFYKDPKNILLQAEAMVEKTGALRVNVRLGADGIFVGNDARGSTFPEAVVKVASQYSLSIEDTVEVLRATLNGHRSPIFATPKMAADDGSGGGGAPPPGGDPAAQGAPMDPNAMAAMMGPPPPSPLDLAVSEQMQMLNQQMAALQQQMMGLQTLQMRTQQIAGGGGAMAAPMGAAAMSGGPAMGPMGMPAMAPVPGMMPGMPQQPGMMPGMPQQPGMPPQQPGMPPQGGDPSMMQGQPMPGGMPPGAAQPGMPGGDPTGGAGGGQIDPATGQPMPPPPPPVMTESPTPENIASQISPAFLDQAGQLEDAQVFDAVAVASLAKQRGIAELVESYRPTLDRALDNLGRTLLLLRIQESDVKLQIGDQGYDELCQNVEDVFHGLGDALLKINQTADQPPVAARPGR